MKIRNIIVAAALFTSVLTFAQKNNKSELPIKAQQFLTENFPDKTVSSVVVNPKDSKKGFKAILSDKTEVEFWKNGNWREIDGNGKAISTNFIVQKVLDYVNANYAKENITRVEYSLGTINIALSNKKNLEFDIDGKFVK